MQLMGIHSAIMGGISDDGVRVGVIQFGNKAYTETELGATHNLKQFLAVTSNMQFRNDDYNDVPGALDAAINMLNTQQV